MHSKMGAHSRRPLMFVGLLGAALVFGGVPGEARAQPAAPTPATAPIDVSAGLTQLPVVGQTTTLRVTVNSPVARPGAEVAIELPSNLAWARVPRGLLTSDRVSAAPTRAGTVHRAAALVDLAAGTTTYEGAVTATAAGYAEITASASAARTAGRDGDGDVVIFTVAEPGAESRAGAVADDTTAVPATVDTSAIPLPARSDKPADPNLLPPPPPDPDPDPVIACATGTALYQDAAGNNRASQYLRVQVIGFSTVLATGYTSRSGTYKVCFDTLGGEPDVQIRFTTDNPHWVVAQNGTPFTWTTGALTVTGDTVDFGQSFPPALKQRAAHAFDELADVWYWIPDACWDGSENPCRKYKVNWGPDVVEPDGITKYDPNTNTVRLQAEDPDTPDVVVHEVGHAVLDDLFNDAPMPVSNCSPHYLFEVSSDTCAWVEGWADWFPLAVYGKSVFGTNPFDVTDIDLVEYNNAGGTAVEVNVAGALLDLGDGAISVVDYWDYANEGPHSIFNTARDSLNAIHTFQEYWDKRADKGSASQGSAYNNGIQLPVFYDPLPSSAPRTRPVPSPAQNFQFDAPAAFWSVVGVRPSPGRDVNVKLLDLNGSALAESKAGASVTDFVAVDSNKVPAATYRASVSLGSSTLPYGIELSVGSPATGSGSSTQTITMGGDRVIVVRDLMILANKTVKVTLTPLNNQDPEIFLLSSSSGNFVTRAGATASSTSGTSGQSEEFTFTNNTSANTWYGVVVTNPTAASGSYTLTVTQLN